MTVSTLLGPVAFLALAALLGLAISAVDLIVAQRPAPVRRLLGMGFTQCALLSRAADLFLTMRGVLPMMAVLWLLRRFRFSERPFRRALSAAQVSDRSAAHYGGELQRAR